MIKIKYTGRGAIGWKVVDIDKPFASITLDDLKRALPDGCSPELYIPTQEPAGINNEALHKCDECLHEMLCLENTMCPICGGELR